MYFQVALKLFLEIKLSIAGMGLILRGNRFITPFFYLQQIAGNGSK